MNNTDNVSINRIIAAEVLRRAQRDLEHEAEQASIQRGYASNCRNNADKAFIETGMINVAKVHLQYAVQHDRQAELHDAEFKALENICIEITRAIKSR